LSTSWVNFISWLIARFSMQFNSIDNPKVIQIVKQ